MSKTMRTALFTDVNKPFASEVYKAEQITEAFESAVKGDKFRVVVQF